MKFQLVLNLQATLRGEDPRTIIRKLDQLVTHHAMGNGLVTGDGPATIDSYSFKTRIIKKKKK